MGDAADDARDTEEWWEEGWDDRENWRDYQKKLETERKKSWEKILGKDI